MPQPRHHLLTDGTIGDQVEVGRHLLDVVGTDGNDLLQGTTADERFLPYLGDDQVYGGGGNDTLKVDYSAQGSVERTESYITGQSNEISRSSSATPAIMSSLGAGTTRSAETEATTS